MSLIEINTEQLKEYVEGIVSESLKKAGVYSTKEMPISRKELMKRLGMNATTLRRNELKGHIPRFMVGGKVKYWWSEVLKALQASGNHNNIPSPPATIDND